MINVGVVGCGYWGPNLIRHFSAHPDCSLRWICDSDEAKAGTVHKHYTHSSPTRHFTDILQDPKTDAVIIATPLPSHFDIAKASLAAGKHVFVEKPFVQTSRQALELQRLSEKKKRVLMVGYTYIYSPAIVKIKEMIASKSIGKIAYIHSARVNFGIFRKHENVLWDLGVHDLSILAYWFREMPKTIICTGTDSLKRGQVDTAFAALTFKSGMISYILTSWLSPVKKRDMIIAGSKKMIFFNDELGTEKIKIYDQEASAKRIDAEGEYHPVYNRSSVFSPWLENVESLKMETDHFLQCIKKGKQPVTDGRMGYELIKILEAAERSLRYNKRITL
jgi:predicted dehydrogenase